MATIINSNKDASGNSTNTLTIALTGALAGDAIIAGAGIEGSQTASFSDNNSGSYATPIALFNGSDQGVSLSYALNVAAGNPTVTITLSANQFKWGAAVIVRGLKTSGALSDSETNSGSGTTVTGTTLTVPNSGIAIGFFGSPGVTSITEDAPWNLIQENENNSFNTGSMIYRIVSPNSFTPSWTKNLSTNWVVVGVSFDDLVTALPFITTIGAKRI